MKSVPPQTEINAHLGNYFTNFALMARDDITSLLDRPSPSCDSQSGASVIVTWPAQTHLCASSKVDMAAAYEMLDEQMPSVCKVVVEDWATAAITWNHMHRSGPAYKYWMIWGCELHRMMHTNDAIIHIYWEHVVKPCAMLLHRNEVKVTLSANDFNSKEQFIRLVAVAGFKWLVSMPDVRSDLIASPTALLAYVNDNLPAHELLHFLLYGGTFALADKAAMRCSLATDLDWAWPYTSILGRASNKTNYAKYGIMMDKVIKDTHPWVRTMMTKYRTHRVIGRPGTGVGKGARSAIEAVSIEV